MSTTTMTATTEASDAVQGGRAVLEEAIARFNAGEYAEYLESFTEDLESYTGIVTPLRFEGLSAWREFIAGLSEAASATYEQRHPTYRAFNGTTVLCNAYFVFTSVSPDGTVERQSGRASHTCVKVDGAWRIANQHYSPMF